jgi:hypothetical protein
MISSGQEHSKDTISITLLEQHFVISFQCLHETIATCSLMQIGVNHMKTMPLTYAQRRCGQTFNQLGP